MAATRVADQLWWGWLRSYRDGELALPGLPPLQLAGLAEAYDLVGFTYRGALGVGIDGDLGPHPADGAVGALGDVAWNEGLGLALRRVSEDGPDRPLILLGHTIATGDPDRDHPLTREAIAIVEAARDEGIDVRGYFHNPPIAGYDWHHGNRVDHGLFDRTRSPLPVADLYRERAGSHPDLGARTASDGVGAEGQERAR
jgi:beta-glucosidase